MGDKVSVESGVYMLSSSISISDLLARFLGVAHKDGVCIRAFIEVNVSVWYFFL